MVARLLATEALLGSNPVDEFMDPDRGIKSTSVAVDFIPQSGICEIYQKRRKRNIGDFNKGVGSQKIYKKMSVCRSRRFFHIKKNLFIDVHEGPR